MDFKPPCLKPLARQRSLKNIAVLDIETNRWLDPKECFGIPLEQLKRDWHGKHLTPFLITWYHHLTKNTWVGDAPECMKDFLLFYLQKKHRDIITFAHYGGGFDFNSLHETLVNNHEFDKYTTKLAYVNGGIMLMRIKDKSNHQWVFRDSSYLLKHSLPKLCESFNPSTKKLEMPPYPYEQHKEEWRRYNMNDCISLAEILTMFNDLIINQIKGSMGITSSSTALSSFKYRFLHRELPTYFTWNDFIRLGYHGGRTEVFNMYAKYRGEPYYLLDVNSMYPSMMHDNIYPVSTPKRVHYQTPWDVAGRCGIMECNVIAPEDLHIPLLPYREPETKKLLFPLGHWQGVYEFSLIEKALELGYKIQPLRTIEFEGDYLFKEYVETLHPIKQNSVGALRETAKLLLNGLYGKFGERSRRLELITDPNADILGCYPIPDDPFGYVTKEVIRFCAHHQPAIAARVTALSQLKLYQGFEQVHHRDGIVYYTDTDSMVTDTRIPTGSRLGEWDMKIDTIQRAVFFAPKAYCYEYINKKGEPVLEQKLKGFSNDFSKALTFDDYRRALPPWNDFGIFNENRMGPASFKEIYNRRLHGFSIIVKNRNVKNIYDKRQINEDYTTEPLTMPVPITPQPFRQPRPDYSKKEKRRRLMTPQNITERNMVERIHHQYRYPKDVIMQCLNISRDYDFDLEHEVDWQSGDPVGQTKKMLHIIDMDDYKYS